VDAILMFIACKSIKGNDSLVRTGIFFYRSLFSLFEAGSNILGRFLPNDFCITWIKQLQHNTLGSIHCTGSRKCLRFWYTI